MAPIKLPKVSLNHQPGLYQVSTSKCSTSYNMSHVRRGYCLIFNQSTFNRVTKLEDRSDADRDLVKQVFSEIGFEAIAFNNLTKDEIFTILNHYAKERDHTDCDCFAIFFLSYSEDKLLFAADRLFNSDELFLPFLPQNCPTLVGKPKLFFIQASPALLRTTSQWEDEVDHIVSFRVPSHLDYVIVWSTIPEAVGPQEQGAVGSPQSSIDCVCCLKLSTDSLDDETSSMCKCVNKGHTSPSQPPSGGSLFVRSLAKVLREHRAEEDLLSMMSLTNRLILKAKSNLEDSLNCSQDVSSTMSTTTRLIFFY